MSAVQAQSSPAALLGAALRTVAVTGGSSAPGITTVAVHLAHALARHHMRTVLVDADPDGGFVAHWLGKAPGAMPTLVNAARYGPVGAAQVLGATESLRENLRLLSGFDVPQPGAGLPAELGRQVLDALAGSAQVVVVDCGRLRPDCDGPGGRRGWTQSWLDAANGAVFVLTPDLAGAVRVGQARPLLDEGALPAWRVSVVNRYDRRTALAGFEEALRREIGLPLAARVPRNDRAFEMALTGHRIRGDRGVSRIFDQLAGMVLAAGSAVPGAGR